MIGLWMVVANGFWILGSALVLATFSYAWWQSRIQRLSLRAVLHQSGVRRTLGVGLALFASGMAATGGAWWEWVLWGGLALFWAGRACFRRGAGR